MTKNWKITIVVLLVFGLFLLLWMPKSKQVPTEANEESEIGSSQIVKPRTKSLDNVPPVDPDGTIARETKEQREIRLKNELMKSLDNPVNFWGKVIDEKGNPISGAEAKISVTDRFSLNPTADNTRTEYLEVSDSNGLFSLVGKKEDLSTSMCKLTDSLLHMIEKQIVICHGRVCLTMGKMIACTSVFQRKIIR